jgi:hypothetical protein
MFEIILAEWEKEIKNLSEASWSKKLSAGDLKVQHYKGFLQETYHHAGLNPQIQAYATMFFKDNPRDMIGMFFKHAVSEIGHDLLALNDLKVLGEDPEVVKMSKPLPSTIALNAFVLYQIQFVSPICYLGYLFHLEFLPTLQGPVYMEQLKKIGVPVEALTFLEEHATIDIGHNKMMKKYIKELVKTDADLQNVLYTAKASCHLHQRMISDAIENGGRGFRPSILNSVS